MTSDVEFAREMVRAAHEQFEGQVGSVTFAESLFAAGGWRSGLGVLKHIGGWLHVYNSYAFDPDPKHWGMQPWPRGLIDEVELSQDYLDEVVAWIREGFDGLDASLRALPPGTLHEPRKAHWGGELPLHTIATLTIQHAVFHLGEFNMLLSIKREEAWEWTEEVEENHIDTYGHSLRPEWMSDDMAARYTAYAAERRKARGAKG